MAETIRAHERRLRAGYFDTILTGHGLDIGAGDDPVTPDCDVFEKQRPDNGAVPAGHRLFTGDAHKLDGVERASYDFVYASHVLEHLENPIEALRTWFDCLKEGGYLFVTVPHRDYYERRRLLPSRWNADHKCFWIPSGVEPPATFGLFDVLVEALHGQEWRFVLSPTSYVTESDRLLPEHEHAQNEYTIEAIVRKGSFHD